MSAATADRDAKRSEGRLKAFAVAASTVIYKDTLVGVNANGYLVPMSDASGLYFMGVAIEKKDNSAGSNGDKTCRVRRDGEFEFVYGGGDATIALLGEIVYANDDQTVDEDPGTATNEYQVGVIVEYVSATKVRIDIGGAVKREGALVAAITSLTDSTGDSATHNDTLADGLTATAPAAVTEYTPHAAGAVAVTSNAATDLDTTAAALNTLVDEVQALQVTVAACVTDLTVQNQNDSDLAQKINEILTALRSAGILAQ